MHSQRLGCGSRCLHEILQNKFGPRPKGHSKAMELAGFRRTAEGLARDASPRPIEAWVRNRRGWGKGPTAREEQTAIARLAAC